MRSRNSATSGLMSIPGCRILNMPASRDSCLRSEISASPAPGYWIFTATGSVFGRAPFPARGAPPPRPVPRADAARGGGAVVEVGKFAPPVRAELFGERLVHV